MSKRSRIAVFFTGWFLLAVAALVVNILNIEWSLTPIWQGILILVVLCIIQASVLELVVLTIATIIYGNRERADEKKPCKKLSLLLNYNLLALSKDDIEETYKRMFNAYMANLQPNVAAVLISATNDKDLKEHELRMRDSYRGLIHDTLMREGHAFHQRHYGEINTLRLEHVWKQFLHLDRESFVRERLSVIVEAYVRDFMCVHRVSRVLKKCGQYQDIMLLSDGDYRAFTYTDKTLYGSMARKYDEHLFHSSPDVLNILGRKFDYTLVLDGDTKVPPGAALELLGIAAAHPDAAIIQPAIIMDVDERMDTIFMCMERIRQDINAPVTSAVTEVLSHSGFYGKGLIQNKPYIENVIGTREHPIERVPIDVLSHDTFEAAVLETYFAGSVGLLEAPCFNYVSWNIRERRWNKGEVLLSMYFWKTLVGKPMRALQRCLQGKNFVETHLRTESKLNFVSSYLAQSAIRQMFMKPLLLIFILLHMNVHLRFSYYPIIAIMFLIIVFPKFATCNRNNFKYVLLESIASILQFTPEAVVGTVRIIKAYQGNLSKNCKWTPQMAVEEEFRNSNPFVSSFKHLWGYSLIAVIIAVPVALFFPQGMLVYIMLITLFILPLYTGVTSYTLKLKTPRSQFRLYGGTSLGSTDSLGTASWTDYSGMGYNNEGSGIGHFNSQFPTFTGSIGSNASRTQLFKNHQTLFKPWASSELLHIKPYFSEAPLSQV